MNSPRTALSPWRIRRGERATSPGAPPSPGATGLARLVAAPSPALPPSAAGEGAAETRRVVAATPAPGATATTPTGRLSPGSAAGSSARGMGVVAPQTPTPGGLGVGRPTDMDTHGDGGPISVGPNTSRAGLVLACPAVGRTGSADGASAAEQPPKACSAATLPTGRVTITAGVDKGVTGTIVGHDKTVYGDPLVMVHRDNADSWHYYPPDFLAPLKPVQLGLFEVS